MSLAFHDVTLRWPDGDVVLDHFSATVPDGRSGLVGANGTGKSTLLRLLAGELQPTAGSVSAPERVAWLRQDLVLRDDEPVDEHLGIAAVRASLRAIEAGDVDQRLGEHARAGRLAAPGPRPARRRTGRRAPRHRRRAGRPARDRGR